MDRLRQLFPEPGNEYAPKSSDGRPVSDFSDVRQTGCYPNPTTREALPCRALLLFSYRRPLQVQDGQPGHHYLEIERPAPLGPWYLCALTETRSALSV
jgi:hypothetical protein